jgi:hypothetical protein
VLVGGFIPITGSIDFDVEQRSKIAASSSRLAAQRAVPVTGRHVRHRQQVQIARKFICAIFGKPAFVHTEDVKLRLRCETETNK